jgi:uncharacterized protein (TIGR03663 family)
MNRRASVGIFLGLLLLAAPLRLPDLSARPMHADEAVHADKFGTLLEGGGYAYDPSEYHGPTLYYMTLVPAALRGQQSYVELDEVTLRLVPAVLGVVLVVAHVAAAPFLGTAAATLAGLLAALSPAMVYYSRYYIHEVPLVLFTFGTLLALGAYVRRPGWAAAVAAGLFAGLMLATKETAVLSLGSMVVALMITRLVERRRGDVAGLVPARPFGRHLLGALAAATLVGTVLFSSFLSHPAGLPDAVRSLGFYMERATSNTWHFHPWYYYLGLLLHFPARGTPFWTEGLIVGLAVVGGVAGWVGGSATGPNGRALRFLGLYTLTMVVVYAAIPYKTPWSLLGFLHGMILLAGAGGIVLIRRVRGRGGKALLAVLLAMGVAHLGWQAWFGSFRLPADPRNPYVYAHTSTDVFEIAGGLEALSRAHPEGRGMRLQVISQDNLWPLPWYLRAFTHVEWWSGVSDEARLAPVILITPDMEPALVRRLYDVPPPGQRELYVRVFDPPVELRPQVEVRAYAAVWLWEAVARAQADSVESAGPGESP